MIPPNFLGKRTKHLHFVLKKPFPRRRRHFRVMSINLNVAPRTSCFKVLNLRRFKALRSLLLLILIIMPVLFLGISGSNAASNILLWLYSDKEAVGIGETFNVTIMVTIPSSYAAEGFQFRVEWNSTVLNATTMMEGLYHSITPESEWDNIWKIAFGYNNTGRYADYAYTFLDTDRATEGGYAPIPPGTYTVAIITFNGTGTGRCLLDFASDPPIVVGDLQGHLLPATGVGVLVSVGNLPPIIGMIRPQDGGYSTIPVNLTVAVNKPLSWIGYSLDDQANVTLAQSSNATLMSNLIQVSEGQHSLVVYANDSSGLMASSNKVSFLADGTPPTVSLDVSPSTSEAAAELVFGTHKWKFNFTASGSHAHLTNISAYFWDFGDGTNSTDPDVTHEYSQPGTYNVTLEVTDLAGNTATQFHIIMLNPVSEPLGLTFGLVAVIVIPVVWVPALAFYLMRTKRKRKKV
jgi:hypothetical protein